MENFKQLSLEIPDESHEQVYVEMMERWESLGEKIAPQLLGRKSGKTGENVPYSRWLEWCEDDRTTGASLSTKIPCTLYFLMEPSVGILGGVVINHANTHRGHIHLGIAPWHRNKGYGTAMLKLALDHCRRMGFESVDIVPYRGNDVVIKVIRNNGGVLRDEFCEDGVWSERYSVSL